MDLDHTSSKGGVEYSACFQQSLASWYGRSMRVMWYPRWCDEACWRFCFHWMMQHTDFVQFMGSLAVFGWFWCLMHVCMRISLSMASFRFVVLENQVFG